MLATLINSNCELEFISSYLEGIKQPTDVDEFNRTATIVLIGSTKFTKCQPDRKNTEKFSHLEDYLEFQIVAQSSSKYWKNIQIPSPALFPKIHKPPQTFLYLQIFASTSDANIGSHTSYSCSINFTPHKNDSEFQYSYCIDFQSTTNLDLRFNSLGY